jgi:hypothetical protein
MSQGDIIYWSALRGHPDIDLHSVILSRDLMDKRSSFDWVSSLLNMVAFATLVRLFRQKKPAILFIACPAVEMVIYATIEYISIYFRSLETMIHSNLRSDCFYIFLDHVNSKARQLKGFTGMTLSLHNRFHLR